MEDEHKDPFREFGGREITPDAKDPFSAFGGKEIKKKESSESNYITQIGSADSEQSNGSSGTPKSKPVQTRELAVTEKDNASVKPLRREVSEKSIAQDNEAVKQKIKQLATASKPYTQISPEKQASIDEDYNKAKNKTGFVNTVKQFGIDALNTVASGMHKIGMIDEVGDLEVDDPLKKAKEQTLQDVKEQGITLNNNQFNEAVKQNFIDNRKSEVLHSQLNDFNQNLSDEERGLLGVDRHNKLENLDSSQKELLQNTQILKHNRGDDFDEYKDVISEADKYKTLGQELPQELSQKKDYLENNIQNYNSEINKNYEKFNNNKKDIGTFQQEMDVYKTEGNDYLNFLGHVSNATQKLGADSLDFLSYLAKNGAPIAGSQISDALHQSANTWNKSIENNANHLKQTTTIESPLDFVNKTNDIIADNIPLILGLTATGGAGVAGIGATTAGGKFGEMENENAQERAKTGKDKYSAVQTALIPLAWGGTVLAPMATQLKTIQNGARVLTAIERETPELIQKSLKEKASEYLSNVKEFGKNSFKLGNDLKVMGILQEGVNHYGLGKEVDYNKLTDLGVYAEAPIMHGMAKASPVLLGLTIKPFISDSEVKTMDANSAKILDLTKKLEDPTLEKEDKVILQSTIDNLAKNSKDIINKKIKSIAETPKEVQEAIVDKTLESSNIRSQAMRIKTSDALSDAQKEIALNDLKERYTKNESERVNLISGDATVLDVLTEKQVIKLQDQAGRELMKEANPDGEKKNVKIEPQAIRERAIKIYNDQKAIKDAEAKIPTSETKSEAEVQKSPENPQEVTPNEIQAQGDNLLNGEVRPTVEPSGESTASEQQVIEPKSVPEAVDGGASEKPVEVENNGIVYSKNENGNWVNTNSGNEVKGIGDKGKALIEQLDASYNEKNNAETPLTQEVVSEKEQPKREVGASHENLENLADRLGLEQPKRGEYIDPKEQLERGKLLVKNGADAKDVEAEFNRVGKKKVSADEISVARAYQQDLVKKTDRLADENKQETPEYEETKKELERWNNDVLKPMGTVFHETGSSLQGVTDVDTGSFHSVKRAFEDKQGKPTTKEQDKLIAELTEKVKSVEHEVSGLTNKLDAVIKEGADKEAKKSSKDKSKELADRIRKLKIHKPKTFHSATPASLIWDGAVEIVAKSIEAGGSIADAIKDGLAHVKSTDWYKKLTDEEKKEATESFENAFKDRLENTDILTRFVDKTDNKFDTDEVQAIWKYAKENYLDKDFDYSETINNVGTDLGLNSEQVREAIAQPKGARVITDEMYMKINRRRNAINRAKYEINNAGRSKLERTIRQTPNFFFKLLTFGHGTVAPITHAGNQIFKPAEWKQYAKFMLNTYKDVGSIVKYEKARENLLAQPDFVFWKRNGLAVDPEKAYEDYVRGESLLGKLSQAGDRGFFALKPYRLELARKFYDGLPESIKADPKTAKEIAKLVNHSTGAHEINFGHADGVVNTIFFAPKLEATKWANLIVDPVKATEILVRPSKHSIGERASAKLALKKSATMIATYSALLVANSAMLALSGSKDKINLTDPLNPNWLKFKVGGKNVEVSGGMLASLRLMASIIDVAKKYHTGKHTNKTMGSLVEQQLRYKLSPFASTIADVAEGTDAMGRPLPYLGAKNKHKEPYTVWSYMLHTKTPIPVAEAIREYDEEMKRKGMTDNQIRAIVNGVGMGAIVGATGAKISSDFKTRRKEK